VIGNVRSNTYLIDKLTGIKVNNAIKLKRVIEKFVEEIVTINDTQMTQRKWV